MQTDENQSRRGTVHSRKKRLPVIMAAAAAAVQTK